MEKAIYELDENMKIGEGLTDGNNISWFDPKKSPVRISGFYWMQEDGEYLRLPKSSFSDIAEESPNVNNIARATTGGQIAFKTTSSRVCVSVKLGMPHSMYHMTAVGQCGFDAYAAYPGEDFYFLGATAFDRSADSYSAEVVSNLGSEEKRIIINMPLYERVEELYIGIDKGSSLSMPDPYEDSRPVVFYGTSITQGGCASRPGMAYTNILSRRINREFINLGFSGHGKGEQSLARAIAKIQDPALIAINYEANAFDDIYRTLDPFILTIREKHPSVPILLMSRIDYRPLYHNREELEKSNKRREFQRQTALRLKDKNIYFVDGRTLMGNAPHECTVDTIHPTDLGFWLIAEKLEGIIRKLIKKE